MSVPKLAYRAKDLAERVTGRKIVVSSRPLRVSFVKRFLSVRMDITSRCNLRCIICPRSVEGASAGRGYDMRWELFSKIADEVFPRASELFLSCGSEPLMAKHFPQVLEVVAKAGVPLVGFTSNGLLFNEDIARRVVDSGINEIEISFDGATESTFSRIRGAPMSKVIEKVKLLNAMKKSLSSDFPQIVFHATLMLSNIEEIIKIVEIAHELGVSGVRALHFYPHAVLNIDNESLYNHRDLYDSHITAARRRAEELDVSFFAPLPFGEGKECGRPASSGNSQNRLCVFPWTMVRILPDGGVLPCATWLENESFGNLNEQRFTDIWYGKRFRQLREDIRSNRLPSACRQCPTFVELCSQPSVSA